MARTQLQTNYSNTNKISHEIPEVPRINTLHMLINVKAKQSNHQQTKPITQRFKLKTKTLFQKSTLFSQNNSKPEREKNQ